MKFKKSFVVLICLFLSFSVGVAHADSIRLGVMKFITRADGVSSYQAEAAGDVFVRVLANNTDNISILERERLDEIGAEQRLSMSGLVDANKAVQIGRVAGCQYMLMGTVTNLKSKQSSINLPFGIGVGVRESAATATLDVRIVDVETTEIVGAFSETGTGKQSGTSLSVMGVAFDNDELSGMEAEAIAKATEKLAPKIIKLLTRTRGGDDNYSDITFRRSRTANSTHAERRMEESRTANRALSSTRSNSLNSRTTTETQRNDYDDNNYEQNYDESQENNSQAQTEFENYSTRPEDVIPTYGLEEKRAENLINAHNRFWKTSNKKSAYERISNLFYDNKDVDYLAAYRSGILAQQLGMKDDAKAWFETALDINPNYEPAQKAKANVDNKTTRRTSTSSKKRKKR